MTERLLAVHAHPDDESSKGAATYAYYRDRGAKVMVVSCTGGERGSILNDQLHDMARAERDLAGLRRLEMARAREFMGIEHRWLGYQDSGLPDEGEQLAENCFATIPVEIEAEPLVRIIREFRPHVLVTYDENGGYPHPDHIRTHVLSMLAYEAAADPDAYPDAGEPWQISKVYYDQIFNLARLDAIYDGLQEREPEHPMLEKLAEFKDRRGDRPHRATTSVPAGDFFDVRDSALRAHSSQVSPDSAFFFWPNDLQQEFWPFEDFELAASVVATEFPENDLFAGISPEEISAEEISAEEISPEKLSAEDADR